MASRSVAGVVRGAVCRETSPRGPCAPVPLPAAASPLRIHAAPGSPPAVLWTDTLLPELAGGPVRPLFYRLQLSNVDGHSAGYSDPVLVAAGTAPPPVSSLRAEGSRLGVLLGWTPQPGAGEVLLERQQLDPVPTPAAPSKARKTGFGRQGSPLSTSPPAAGDTAGVLWLQAEPGNTAAARTLDNVVTDGYRYRYVAVRRIQATVAGKPVELRSAPSTPVEITWKDVYPPASPVGLTAVGFQVPPPDGAQTQAAFAVDLIWEPVRDLRVVGYLVRRTPLSPSGSEAGPALTLTPHPLTTPAFHDVSALPGQAYRYEVTAIDGKGNLSAPAVTTLSATNP